MRLYFNSALCKALQLPANLANPTATLYALGMVGNEGGGGGGNNDTDDNTFPYYNEYYESIQLSDTEYQITPETLRNNSSTLTTRLLGLNNEKGQYQSIKDLQPNELRRLCFNKLYICGVQRSSCTKQELMNVIVGRKLSYDSLKSNPDGEDPFLLKIYLCPYDNLGAEFIAPSNYKGTREKYLLEKFLYPERNTAGQVLGMNKAQREKMIKIILFKIRTGSFPATDQEVKQADVNQNFKSQLYNAYRVFIGEKTMAESPKDTVCNVVINRLSV